ncbi:MAG: hypothetical protein K940chlam6_01686 [Chlamydiae bacterium]|nr:hypothetical protein [Chlamydiota bacterium]
MSSITSPPVLHSFSEYNKILGQEIEQCGPNGNPITMTFLPAIYNAEKTAEGLLGRVKKTHTQFYQAQDKEGLRELLKQYQDEHSSLQALITLANNIAAQLMEMPLNENSPLPIGAPRIVTKGDIQREANDITNKAFALNSEYCTRSSIGWHLADYMHSLEKMVPKE